MTTSPTRGGGDAPSRPPRGGGPPAWFAAVAIGGILVGVVLIVAQLLGIGFNEPAASATLAPAGEAASQTRALVVDALGRASFQVREPQVPYRPGESPALVSVPRVLLQAVLPSDPAGGYVIIYELPTNNDADAVGREFAAYLASGTGAIQYPRDTRFVLQRVGRTLVFFPWSAEANPDPRLADLAAALETVGQPIAG